MQKILHVVGARPNFMKIAPIMHAMAAHPKEFEQFLVHTGQHYDERMSQIFFDELGMPKPDVNLEVGSGSHAWQTGEIMQRFEPVLLNYQPDWVLVPGDVNSTVACAMVASKLGIKVAHVESGLRSFDRSMPEELNRIITDHLADVLFTPEPSGRDNLLREGISEDRIHFVGNTMIDTLIRLLPNAQHRWTGLATSLNIQKQKYVLVTLHRPSNVDEVATLQEILTALSVISLQIPVVFPVHPRTRQRIGSIGVDLTKYPQLQLTEPRGYLDFLAFQANALVVLTDSGGVQEETTYLQVPCLTVRPNTERPVTITHGTNRLVDSKSESIVSAFTELISTPFGAGIRSLPPLWDGFASERIAVAIAQSSYGGYGQKVE